LVDILIFGLSDDEATPYTSFENVESFKYFETTVTNNNDIHK